MSSGSSRAVSGLKAALALLVLVAAGLVALNLHMRDSRAAQAPAAHGNPPLRVCADPNNLPFSNDREQGFENAIARLIAKDLQREVQYTWWPQRRGFIRNTLQAQRCDLVIGVPSGFEMASTTAPYYRSGYAFVTRAGDALDIRSLDDPRLERVRIGLHAIGDDYSNVPPAQALARRGIAANVRGYSIYGDYSKPNPPADLIVAVANGEIDVAIAWGPLAGYFAQHSRVPLRVELLPTDTERDLPMSFAISMGVRRGEQEFKATLEHVLDRRRADIERTLESFGVPIVEPSSRQALDEGD